jgi:hypothetical protein
MILAQGIKAGAFVVLPDSVLVCFKLFPGPDPVASASTDTGLIEQCSPVSAKETYDYLESGNIKLLAFISLTTFPVFIKIYLLFRVG